jgi:hypothetical protein
MRRADVGADRCRGSSAAVRPGQAKIIRTRPRVATISDRKGDGEARSFSDTLTAAPANIRFAITAPPMHPATWAGMWTVASRQDRPPKAAPAKETTGVK